MATQAQASPQQYQWANNQNKQANAGGIIGQIFAVFTRPASFFQRMPYTRHWLFAALVILGAAGYAAVNQVSTMTHYVNAATTAATIQAPAANANGQSNGAASSFTPPSTAGGANTGESNGAAGNAAPPASSVASSTAPNAAPNITTSSNANAATGQTGDTAANANTANGTTARRFGTRNATDSATNTAAAAVTTTTLSTENTTPSVLVLFAIGGIVATWFGQALLLSLVPMLNGYAPSLGRNFQLAVWASLPLAVMLILRQINFASGGTGGSLGLSALVAQWSDFTKLGDLAQRIVTTFLSNVTFFWLWSLVLLYIGARYVLKGNRLSSILVIVAWVAVSSIVPALITTPVTSITPKTAVTTTQQNTTTTTNTNTTSTGTNLFNTGTTGTGSFPTGGDFPGGAPPSGSGNGGSNNNTNRTNR